MLRTVTLHIFYHVVIRASWTTEHGNEYIEEREEQDRIFDQEHRTEYVNHFLAIYTLILQSFVKIHKQQGYYQHEHRTYIKREWLDIFCVNLILWIGLF